MSYIPNSEKARRDMAVNMTNAIRNDLVKYGVSQTLFDDLDAKVIDLVAKMTANDVAHDDAQAARAAKDTAMVVMIKILRIVAQIIQNYPEITPELLEAAGLHEHDKIPTPIVLYVPDSLTAEGDDKGDNRLRWKAGENKPHIMYAVEAKIDPSPDFVMIDVVTKTNYVHKGQTPGVRVSYRVRAKKNEAVSAPSNVATVYEV